MMNGYENKGFGDEPESMNFVKAFDAFPKAKPQYVRRTPGGGKWTVAMSLVSVFLVWAELWRWWGGVESHTFSIEKIISHEQQINLDVVVHMACKDLHVNVQDAAGDRILAATKLKHDPTNWSQYVDNKGVHALGRDANGKADTGAGWHEEGFGEEHVHDIVALMSHRGRWAKTPSLWGKGPGDSCRIYGNLDINKVQGDFHITARGHGYAEYGEHLDHTTFNFSHIVNELSFGQFFPRLVNPLDRTVNVASTNFHKFQYFLSIVPTIYSMVAASGQMRATFTNQYAVTEQSMAVDEYMVPGIFFKYDFEPILVEIEERRESYLSILVKLINVLSGVLVAGHWGFTLTEWFKEVVGKRKRQQSMGMIGHEKKDYEE